MTNIPVGIDLGSTAACIAYVAEGTKPHTYKIIPSTGGNSTTPTVVSFVEKGGSSEVMIGENAEE